MDDRPESPIEFNEESAAAVEGMKVGKPDWWPKNPYPVSVFPMSEERYPEIVSDPGLRTALSGMLGRQFWDIASEAIWAAMLEVIDDALWNLP